MEVRCAWCRSDYSEGKASGRPLSHALCPACFAELAAGLQQSGLRLRATAPAASD